MKNAMKNQKKFCRCVTRRFLLCTMAEQGQKMTKTPLKYHQVGDLFIQIMIRGKKHDDRIVKKKNFKKAFAARFLKCI